MGLAEPLQSVVKLVIICNRNEIYACCPICSCKIRRVLKLYGCRITVRYLCKGSLVLLLNVWCGEIWTADMQIERASILTYAREIYRLDVWHYITPGVRDGGAV